MHLIYIDNSAYTHTQIIMNSKAVSIMKPSVIDYERLLILTVNQLYNNFEF